MSRIHDFHSGQLVDIMYIYFNHLHPRLQKSALTSWRPNELPILRLQQAQWRLQHQVFSKPHNKNMLWPHLCLHRMGWNAGLQRSKLNLHLVRTGLLYFFGMPWSSGFWMFPRITPQKISDMFIQTFTIDMFAQRVLKSDPAFRSQTSNRSHRHLLLPQDAKEFEDATRAVAETLEEVWVWHLYFHHPIVHIDHIVCKVIFENPSILPLDYCFNVCRLFLKLKSFQRPRRL